MADIDKVNAVVQAAISVGLRGVTTFSGDAPLDVNIDLKDLGNRLNAAATNDTFLESMRSTTLIEKMWGRKKKDKTWKLSTQSQIDHS